MLPCRFVGLARTARGSQAAGLYLRQGGRAPKVVSFNNGFCHKFIIASPNCRLFSEKSKPQQRIKKDDDDIVPLSGEIDAVLNDKAESDKVEELKLEEEAYDSIGLRADFSTPYGIQHAATRLERLKKRPKADKRAQAVVNAICTKNNCHITCTDFQGQAIVNLSAGRISLGGMKKGSPFGGMRAGEEAGAKLVSKGIKYVDLRLKGFGRGRTSVHRGLRAAGVHITSITQTGNLPHNGCRPPKARRL
mmetsp:Transcript_16210/g.18349  ORF Transcript_16210/g.18349 Transcript_16210/m.18349 type:complete len:248 (-) Transcript_16210:793-1536(-)